MADLRGILKDKLFGKAYYDEHVEVGVDYLTCGYWHESYAEMIAEATLQSSYATPFVVDGGCACGAQLEGFRRTGRFAGHLGVDMSRHMISLGRDAFGFSDHELVVGSIERIPVPDGSVTLINTGQVLEHVPDEVIDAVFAEFYRVLAPGGRMFHNLAALKHGDPPDIHDGDPTHYNVKPTLYWSQKFAKAGFLGDFESYDRFARSAQSPGGDFPNFYSTYEIWTSFALIKPVTKPRKTLLSFFRL